MIRAVSNICSTKAKRHTEMKHSLLEGELQNVFVVCRISDVTPIVATRSATVDTAVKS
jgi:hypothetical protein